MAQLAADYWSGIWARGQPELGGDDAVARTAAANRAAGLAAYCKPIDLSTFPNIELPSLPTEAVMATTIRRAGNSCAGADGIPFACYKVVAATSATVLLRVLLELASGSSPPSGFNHGLLFLLPKKGTLLPSDTRPISVTNADNRLIAKAVISALEGYLGQVLNRAQQGFLRGRDGGLNIRGINDFYYKAIHSATDATRRRTTAYLLFLDTAKVFDSIKHNFNFASLHRLHMPDWVMHDHTPNARPAP